ncbi:MAG: hypothetical protein DLM60_05385 [Pseudonocardiales bacterium]|nr:MAG: hypothetical protein DLM60_05385 [Pseudonocardiales bacterium]
MPVATVEGCDAAAITVLTGTDATTAVYSDPIALKIDTVQYEAGQGPCLDAITTDVIVYARTLAEDPRWPCFGPRAVALGMRSLLSCRLSDNGTLAALSTWWRPARFRQADVLGLPAGQARCGGQHPSRCICARGGRHWRNAGSVPGPDKGAAPSRWCCLRPVAIG